MGTKNSDVAARGHRISVEDAESLTGITQQQVSKWRPTAPKSGPRRGGVVRAAQEPPQRDLASRGTWESSGPGSSCAGFSGRLGVAGVK